MQYDLSQSLTGKLLVSSPAIPDNRFYKSVVLITSHDQNQITGIVLNKISAHKFSHIIKNIDSAFNEKIIDLGNQKVQVVLGGPVQYNNLFMIHSNDYKDDNTIKINDYLSFTNKQNIIYQIAQNNGPRNSIISIGCSIWNDNQLNYEILANNWFVIEGNEISIFETPFINLYDECFKRAGFTQNESNSALFLTHTYQC